MLSISFMQKPNYRLVSSDLLRKPKTEDGLRWWGRAYERNMKDPNSTMKVDSYGFVSEGFQKKGHKKVSNIIDSNEVQNKQRGVNENKLGNDDIGYESFEEEQEAIYLVARFIEVHEELMRYSGYNLWLLIEMCLENVGTQLGSNLENTLANIIKDTDLNVGGHITEAVTLLRNKRCGEKLREYFAS